MRSFFREVLVTIILAGIIFLVLQVTVQSSIVVGCSMKPTLEDGQRLLVSKVSYTFHEPERGDIIIFHPPGNRQADYIKRIIGLPGDTVEVKEGKVYINGVSLDEPYIKEPPVYSTQQSEIEKNNYFVLGDNRNNSNDSHNNWTVPRQSIIGKTWLSIWPPDAWGFAPNYSLPD